MSTDPLLESLKNPACYSHAIGSVHVVETHISWVVLTGEFAYKIKKPVHLSFLDFSILEKRQWFCEEEVRLNRRLEPDIYLGVVPITGSPSAPCVGGKGEPFEYAVQMRQFDPSQEFPELLKNGNLHISILEPLAERIAKFHEEVDVAGLDSAFGRPDVIWKPVEECLAELSPERLPSPLGEAHEQLQRWCMQAWQCLRPCFLDRKKNGYIRECHGDLHLGNIALVQGVPCIFDALEFEPRLRWIDVMSEMAFLVMDLERYARSDLAFAVLNRYLELTGDYEGMAVFRFYEVYRALVRAKVAGIRLSQLSRTQPEWMGAFHDWKGYLELASHVSRRNTQALILMHGISGTGKTTVSSRMLQALDAIRVRSDIERKRMIRTHHPSTSPVDTYRPAVTQATYERLAQVAERLLEAKCPVIVDATFLRQQHRLKFFRMAQRLDVPFCILNVTAPESVRSQRIEARQQEGRDASEATVAVMQRQVQQDEPFAPDERDFVISVDSTNDDSVQSTIRQLSQWISSNR